MVAAISSAIPVQTDAEVLDLRRVGEYFLMTLSAPGAADDVRPGHFVVVAVGGDDSSMLLRRAFSIYRADAAAGTIEIVFAVHGRGTAWLARRRRGDWTNIVAPLGRPFVLPTEPVACALVAGGYGAAPMFGLADSREPVGPRST